MILGYTISVRDIDEHMLDDLPLKECARYSNIYDLNVIDPGFKIRKKRYNISYTYDSFIIVSEKFRNFCEAETYKGIEFVPLVREPGFYWFKVNNIVEFDVKARETRFINYSEACQGFEEIIGATPACLKVKTTLPEGFFRTDIFFGSYAGKGPLYLVGEATKQKLQIAGYKEIAFEEILDKYDWEK